MRKYLAKIGAKGGKKVSPAKAQAVRANLDKANAAREARKSIPLDERSPHIRALKEAGKIVRAGNPDATENPSTELQGTVQPDERPMPPEVERAYANLARKMKGSVASASNAAFTDLNGQFCQPDEYNQQHPEYDE